MPTDHVSVTDEQKVEALQRVLTSTGFHRADVLRTLLGYLSRQESLGRAHEVTEYEIAVKALGRSAEFTPETDSSVRTRLMALRKKLEEFYAGEGREAAVRIDIPRGTYALRFVPAPADTAAALPVAEVPAAPPPAVARRFWPFLFGLLCGMLGLTAAGGVWQWTASRAAAHRERHLRAAWGSMLERGATLTIVIGTPASLFIRDFGQAELPLGDPGYRLPVPRDAEFEEWYKVTRKHTLGPNALLHPNAHSPLWGDAAAAAVLSRVMGEYGVRVEVVPAARVHPVAWREKNAVIIGRPEYTDAAEALVPDDGLAVEFSARDRLMGIHNRAPKPGEPEWWFATGGLRHNFGLITVLAMDGSANKRIVLLSGINSDGAEAGARYFSSNDKLEDLARRFAAAGYRDWPPRYQVVVRTESIDTYSLETRFEFLRVLK